MAAWNQPSHSMFVRIAAMSTGGSTAAGERCQVVASAEAAYDLLVDALRPGDVVLFKSSRDAGLRHLGDRIAQLPPETFAPKGLEGTACSPS